VLLLASFCREIAAGSISKGFYLESIRVDALIVVVPPLEPPYSYSLRDKKKM
jgi:hypothetical protein